MCIRDRYWTLYEGNKKEDSNPVGTNPFVADTDGDTVLDGADAFPLDPTRSTAPAPTPGDTTPPTITLTAPVSARRLQ